MTMHLLLDICITSLHLVGYSNSLYRYAVIPGLTIMITKDHLHLVQRGVIKANVIQILSEDTVEVVLEYIKITGLVGHHCPVHPGVRDKRRVFEIDLSHPDSFLVTSQWASDVTINRPN